MKIKDILNEAKDDNLYERIINSSFFKNNWKPYFDSLDPGEESEFASEIEDRLPMLYHGGKLKNGKINHIIYRASPMDTPVLIHDTINELSEEKFGYSIRAMLFASKDGTLASEYGDPSIMIPVDEDYKFFYSTLVDDMYISNKVFNSAEYKKNIKPYLEELFEKDPISLITDEIHSVFDQFLKPRFSTYLIKHLYNYVDTIFYRVVNSDSVRRMDDYEKIITRNVLEVVYKETYDIISLAYGMEKVADIEDEEFDKLSRLMYALGEEILKGMIRYRKNWIYTESKKYVDSIKVTKKLTEINTKTEIMLPEGDYAALTMYDEDNEDDDVENSSMVELFKYYLRNKE